MTACELPIGYNWYAKAFLSRFRQSMTWTRSINWFGKHININVWACAKAYTRYIIQTDYELSECLIFSTMYSKWMDCEQIYYRIQSSVFSECFSQKFRQHISISISLFILFFRMSYFSLVRCLQSNVAVDISQYWCDIQWMALLSVNG